MVILAISFFINLFLSIGRFDMITVANISDKKGEP